MSFGKGLIQVVSNTGLPVNEPCSVERELNAFAKGINPCFLTGVNFLHITGPYWFMIPLVVKTDRRMMKAKACMTFSWNFITKYDPTEPACVLMYDV